MRNINACLEEQVMEWLVSQGNQICSQGEQFAFIPQFVVGNARIDVLITKPITLVIEIQNKTPESYQELERHILETRIRVAKAISPATPLILFLPEGQKIEADYLAAKCIAFKKDNTKLIDLLQSVAQSKDKFTEDYEFLTANAQEISDIDKIEDLSQKIVTIGEFCGKSPPVSANERIPAIIDRLAQKLGIRISILVDAENAYSATLGDQQTTELVLQADGGKRCCFLLIDPTERDVITIIAKVFLQVKKNQKKPPVILAFSADNKAKKGSNWLYYLTDIINSFELIGINIIQIVKEDYLKEEIRKLIHE
jgi:hypothetical protein